MSATLRLLPSALAVSILLTVPWSPQAARGADENSAKTETDEPGGRNEKSLREQDIYIPYEKLRQVFEKHGRGVFLPYEEFEQLWQAAQDKTRPAARPRPPVGAVITEIENEATVAKDVVRVKATLKIDLLVEGWHEIPLRLADAAITSATLGGQPARIVGAPGEDYRLLVEKKGKQPEQIVLALEYAKAISKMPGQNSVSLLAPQAPVSRWRVRIPQAGVKVNLQPLIAATEVPTAEPAAAGHAGANGKTEEPKPARADETVVLAFVGAAPMVRIDWTPKAEGATGLAALVSVEAEQQVWINEGATRSRVNLIYSISRAELGQLAVEVPADYKVVNVFDANVRQWSVEPLAKDAKRQKITAQLFEPAKKVQQVTVELEKFAGEKLEPSQAVPVVTALDVGRQQGSVVVQVAAGLRAEASRATGLLQVDAGELPESLRRQPWTFSYRYATLPYELVLGVEELQPRVTADSLVEARLEPERLTLDVTAVYNIERGRGLQAGTRRAAGLRPAPRPRLRPGGQCRPAGGRRAGRFLSPGGQEQGEKGHQGPPGGQPRPQGHGPRRPGRRVAEGPPGTESAVADGHGGRNPAAGPASGRRQRRAGHGPAADFRPGKPAGQPGQDRWAPQHLLQGGRRRHDPHGRGSPWPRAAPCWPSPSPRSRSSCAWPPSGENPK